MSDLFSSIFRKSDAPEARGKFLSRVFGIFSEEVVRLWANHPQAPYIDLGRPTLRNAGETRGSTLDFTFQCKATGEVYVVEQKCEIEYQGYRFMVLTDPKQLDHHNKPAFAAFLNAASPKQEHHTFVDGKEVQSHGSILVWGAATPAGRQAVIQRYGLHDVLTIAGMVQDMQEWRYEPYLELLGERQQWANELFSGLLHAQPRA